MDSFRVLDATSSRTPMKESMDITLMLSEESSSVYRIPISNNSIVIAGGEAKVVGVPTLNWDDFSDDDESFVDTILFDDDIVSQKPLRDRAKKGSFQDDISKVETIQFSETSSDDDPDERSVDQCNLPATLRLLEEISFRILGEKSDLLPCIETVEEQEQKNADKKKEDEKSEEEEEEQKQEEEEEPQNAEEYAGTFTCSEKLVDNILQDAKQVCKSKHNKKVVLVSFADAFYKRLNIAWPAIKNFTVDIGSEGIDKYIRSTFVLEEDWKHRIIYLIAQSDKVSDFYLYEARFGIPNSCYPVCQATVSLYFTVEVSRVVPTDLPVAVTFTVESLRRVMVPGEVEINDKTLLTVLYSKLSVYKQLVF